VPEEDKNDEENIIISVKFGGCFFLAVPAPQAKELM
jgi:hypothetical protein